MFINLVSFNLWNDPYLWVERLDWFIHNIIKGHPDIILLQGVSKRTLVKLIPILAKLKYTYITSGFERNEFEMIIVAGEITEWKFNKYSTSKTAKGLLWCVASMNGKTIGIATSDLDDTSLKTGQLKCSLKFLTEKFETCIFNCNFCENYKSTEWKDLWEEGGKNEFCEATVDHKRNNNLYDRVKLRSDRVFFKGNLQPIGFNLIGTEKSCSGRNPSNHFGIQSSIRYN